VTVKGKNYRDMVSRKMPTNAFASSSDLKRWITASH
jgi:hypothetical protein